MVRQNDLKNILINNRFAFCFLPFALCFTHISLAAKSKIINIAIT